MTEIVANGVRLHVQRLKRGDRPRQVERPIVFIHGLGMDNMSSFYYTLANPMANTGAEVILYDLRGYGLSERPRTGYGVSDSIADLTGLLDALDLNGPVHLVGNSYGATVALSFAVKYPERVASIVLIEARVPLEGWAEQWTAEIRKVAADVAEAELNRSIPQTRKYTRLAELWKDLVYHTTFVSDLLATDRVTERQLRMFTRPVRAVYGNQSDILHHAHVLDRLLPQCALTILPNLDHFVLARDPQVVRAIVLDWFTAKTMATPEGLR
jgi:pimeloyl-ACP methyl ester carboxylesterase